MDDELEDDTLDDGMDDGGDDEGMDMQSVLEELQRAEDAGEQYSADSFFAPVPGAGAEGGAPGSPDVQASGQMTPEQLQQLMEMLKAQQGGQTPQG